MAHTLFWLAFRRGHDCWLCAYWAGTAEEASRHGIEHFLDRKLVAVFPDDAGLSVEEMLDKTWIITNPAQLMPMDCSPEIDC